MQPISAVPIDYGFDWITTTALSRPAQKKLQSLGQNLLRSESNHGNEIRPWSFAGYEGFKCGSVQFGSRSDSTCMRLSGGGAFDNWLKAYHAGENFSRVDLQITARTGEAPAQTIQKVYRRALAHTKKRRRGPTCTILKCSSGAHTVYLGKRQSDLFMRCYDKGAESGLDHYENAVRFEVELKGAACLSVLSRCASSGRPLLTAAAYVRGCFADRGVVLGIAAMPLYAVSVPRSRSDVGRKLRWIQTQVGPSVKLLIASGYRLDVLRCLGLSESLSIPSSGVKVARSIRFGGKANR